MTEKFSLKWNEFHANVLKSFALFRNEDYLHDVTKVSRSKVNGKVPKGVSEVTENSFKN